MVKKFLLLVFILLGLPLSVFAEDIQSAKGPGGYAITAFDRGVSKVSVGGYFDTEFIHDMTEGNKKTKFDNHHLILQVGAELHPHLLFSSEIEYEHAGAEIKVEQAWLDFKLSDALVSRAGVIVVPFGRMNILHDSDVRETTDRGLYARYIVPTTWIDTGFGAHGVLDLSDMELNYEAYIVNGLGDTITTADGIRGARQEGAGRKDNNNNKSFVARVGLSPYLGLEFGTSFYTGAYDDEGKQNLSLMGFDAHWKKGPYELLAEFAQGSVDVLAANKNTMPEKMNGYYIEGRYHFSPSWLKQALHQFESPAITVFARLGGIDTDLDNTVSKEALTRTTVGFNLRPIQNVVYKLEYQLNSESETEIDNNAILTSVAVGF